MEQLILTKALSSESKDIIVHPFMTLIYLTRIIKKQLQKDVYLNHYKPYHLLKVLQI